MTWQPIKIIWDTCLPAVSSAQQKLHCRTRGVRTFLCRSINRYLIAVRGSAGRNSLATLVTQPDRHFRCPFPPPRAPYHTAVALFRAMPTSTVPASGNDAATSGARLQSVMGPTQRPSDEANSAEPGAQRRVNQAALSEPTHSGEAINQAVSSTAAPSGEVTTGGEVPAAVQSAPDVAMQIAPRSEACVTGGTMGEQGGARGVTGTQGSGGRGPGYSTTVARGPLEGRVCRNRQYACPPRTKRGPKKTAHQRRFAANRPSGHHPSLSPWDLTPLNIRSSAAGQERSIFRTRGLLVSHLDFPTYEMLSTFNVGQVPTVFPTAPRWWPSDWGRIPITLPWELSLYRSKLVSADPSGPLWLEVYQKFLEQLAGGWDLHLAQGANEATLTPLPSDVALAIVHAGGFAFCAGSIPSASFSKFLELHSISGEIVPDQRIAKNAAWQRIATLYEERKEAGTESQDRTGQGPCRCGTMLSRAARRLGLEAQLLEVANDEASLDALASVEKVAALASAVLTFSLESAERTERVEGLLEAVSRHSYCRELGDALAAVRNAKTLAEFLPRRFGANMARLSASRPSRS